MPLGVGGHVDHQLCRDVGVRLLAEGRRWVMPGPEYAGTVVFYEDFPYAWWNDFERLEDLRRRRLRRRCPPTSRSTRRTPTSATSSSARSPASTSTRARWSGCSTARATMADAVRAYGADGRRARRGRRLRRALLGDRAASDRSMTAGRDGWTRGHRRSPRSRSVVAVGRWCVAIRARPPADRTGLTRRPRPVRRAGSTASRRRRSAYAYDQDLYVPAGHGLHLGRPRGASSRRSGR